MLLKFKSIPPFFLTLSLCLALAACSDDDSESAASRRSQNSNGQAVLKVKAEAGYWSIVPDQTPAPTSATSVELKLSPSTPEKQEVAQDTAQSKAHLASQSATSSDLGFVPPQLDGGQPKKNFWAEYKATLKMPNTRNVPRVKSQIDRYTAHPKHFEKVLQDAQPFIYYIFQQVKARGLPTELSLLPLVESHFNPTAYSPVGAAGLWQIMPTTGSDFGIKENWWYDGRLDVIASTNAALTYLTYLGELYDHDWALALAAYNSGQGTVNNAIRHNAEAKKPTDYWNLNLPKETRDYVPRLAAVVEIVRHSAQYEIDLPSIHDKPYFAVVPMQHQVSLSKVADLTGLNQAVLDELNSGYKHGKTSPNGPMRLLIPIQDLSSFSKNLAAIDKKERVEKINDWRYYTVKSGDTLSVIAHRFTTTVPALMASNHLSDEFLKVGMNLRIPEPSNQKYTLVGKMKRPTRVSSKSNAAQVVQTTHIVQPKETLKSIAKRYNVTGSQIETWNKLKSAQDIHTAQRLIIWEPVHHTYVPEHKKSPKASGNQQYYRVQSGDTISEIADRFAVTTSSLLAENDLTLKGGLQVGQRLLIPDKS